MKTSITKNIAAKKVSSFLNKIFKLQLIILFVLVAAVSTDLFSQGSYVKYLDRSRRALESADGAVYMLECSQLESGLYGVNISILSTGVLVMSGTYTDYSLTTENGCFNYFFANGMPESSGSFTNGIKTGTWSRWDVDGQRKPDRIYPGVEDEEYLASLKYYN